MRSIFVIYLIAGLTLFMAILNSAAYIGQAYVAHRAIVVLKPEGDDLARIQAAQSHDRNVAEEGFILAVLQVVIIVSARKLQKQSMRFNAAQEPTADGTSSLPKGSGPAKPQSGGGSTFDHG